MFLFVALFSSSFDINESRAQQCNNFIDDDGDGFIDFSGMPLPPPLLPAPPDPDCLSLIDDDESVLGGPFYVSYQDPILPFVSATDCAISGACSTYSGDIIGCATGWNCPMNDTSASCYVGVSGTAIGACLMWASAGANCSTVYEACNCTCVACTADGGACAANGDCCSNDCTGGICVASCTADGGACIVDGDCCSSDCTGGICVATIPGSVCNTDTNCDYDSGENMFNCPADCLPPGVPDKLIPDVIDDIISWLLWFAVAISVVALVYGGLCYVFSSGDAQKTENAKKIVKFALLGIFVVGISFAIIVIIDMVFH